MEGVPIKILGRATLKLFGFVKPRANGRNIVGQQLPTLLDVTCCVRLYTLTSCWMLLRVVAQSLKPVKLLATHRRTQQLPTMLGVVCQQCCIRLHTTLRPIVSPILISPLKLRITLTTGYSI